jgi:hypothetical protein
MTEDDAQSASLSFQDGESDDEADWEEVTVPLSVPVTNASSSLADYDPYAHLAEPSQPVPQGNIEITILKRQNDAATECVVQFKRANGMLTQQIGRREFRMLSG